MQACFVERGVHVGGRGGHLAIVRERGAPSERRALPTIEGARADADEQPRLHAAARGIELARALPRLEEDVVDEILHVAGVDEDPERERRRDARVTVVERGERLSLASRDRDDQRFVVPLSVATRRASREVDRRRNVDGRRVEIEGGG